MSDGCNVLCRQRWLVPAALKGVLRGYFADGAAYSGSTACHALAATPDGTSVHDAPRLCARSGFMSWSGQLLPKESRRFFLPARRVIGGTLLAYG